MLQPNVANKRRTKCPCPIAGSTSRTHTDPGGPGAYFVPLRMSIAEGRVNGPARLEPAEFAGGGVAQSRTRTPA